MDHPFRGGHAGGGRRCSTSPISGWPWPACSTWAGYLVTGVTGLAWTACGLLLPVAGLGMTLVFLVPARDESTAPGTTVLGTTVLGTTALGITVLASAGLAARRPGALVIAAHVTAASVTILLAVLAAIGSG